MGESEVERQAGSAEAAFADVQAALTELGVSSARGRRHELLLDYVVNPAYDPVRVKLFFSEDFGVLGAEGLLAVLEQAPNLDFDLALNFLNHEAAPFRFYVAEGADGDELLVRQDLLPSLGRKKAFTTKQIKQALTGLCAQREVFLDPLMGVLRGRPWESVREALRSLG